VTRRVAGWPALAGLLVLALVVPLSVTSPLWIGVLTFAGIYALAAVGLNVLTGYTGQLSIGQAAFVAVGAYAAVVVGGRYDLPLAVWFPATVAAGALVGGLVGPLALRIRGPYLIFVSLALLALVQFALRNGGSFTGGAGGIAAELPLRLGPLDFGGLTFGRTSWRRDQSLCLLVWVAVVAAVGLAANLVKSRAGRAMRAVRDDEVAAAAAGMSVARAKVGAFVVAGALAAAAGGFYAVQVRFISPEPFDVLFSVQLLTAVVVGGVRTPAGPIVGALVLGALPQLTDRLADPLPLVGEPGLSSTFTISPTQFEHLLTGVLLVALLVWEPGGLAALCRRFVPPPTGREQ
jgi:branched-chain amino acid transport system permease protein